jgi:hypothetical protein
MAFLLHDPDNLFAKGRSLLGFGRTTSTYWPAASLGPGGRHSEKNDARNDEKADHAPIVMGRLTVLRFVVLLVTRVDVRIEFGICRGLATAAKGI